MLSPLVSGVTPIVGYTLGDLIVAGSSTAVGRLAGVATGNALISGGVGALPTYGKITSGHCDSSIVKTNTTAYLPFVVGAAGGAGDLNLWSNESNGGKIYLGLWSVYDEGTNRLGILTDTPLASIHIVDETDAASNLAGVFVGNNRVTPTNSDEAYWSFRLDNSAGATAEFARLTWQANDITAASKDGELRLGVMVANSLVDRLVINETGIVSPTLVAPVLGTATATAIGIGAAAGTSAYLRVQGSWTDPSEAKSAFVISSQSNLLTANNAQTIHGFQSDVRLDQGGFNLTASYGVRGSTSAAYAKGASGTVTGVAGMVLQYGNLGAGALTNAYGFVIASAVNTGGGTVGTVYGIDISAQTVGSTNNIGIRSQVASSATGGYNLYISGTADNYLNGNLGIGTTTFGTSATKTLALFNGTVPSTSPADMIQLFSVDLSAGNATLGLRTETEVVTEVVVSDRTLSVVINGTNYKICLKA